jgi:hypothetical protein
MAGAIFCRGDARRTQRHVHLQFFDQLTFAADTVQIAHKKRPEQEHRIDLRTSGDGTVKVPYLIADEVADLGHPQGLMFLGIRVNRHSSGQ